MNLVLMLDPTPPSRLQPEVPLDLETICLKCLQKESRHRYPNCFALAEDLHRFLAGEPIQARPVSRAERLWRWCKRNPRVAMLAASTLVLLLAGVIVSSVAAWTIAQERNQKELERQAAEAARGLAEERKIEADRANEQAQRNAQLALKQSGLALGAYGALIDEVQRVIGDSPGTQEVKLKLLETALAGLDKVAKSDENARLLDQSMAAEYMKMGQLFQQLGQIEKAITQYEKCHEIIRARAEKDPEGDVAQANLAATYTMLGAMSLELKRDMQASLEYYQKALAIRKKLNSRTLGPKLDATKVRQDLTESLTRIGVTFLRLGEAKEARPYFQEALALRQELANQMPNDLGAVLDVARSLNALGDVEFKSRNASIAKGYYEQAVQLNERVQQEDKDNPKATWELANTLGNYAVFEMRTGNLAPAQKLCTRYRTLMQELVDLDPKNSNYLRYLGLAHYRMATIARRLDDAPTAERCNRACLEIREKLVAADEKNERRPVELMLVLPRCGQHARAAELAAKIQQRPNIDREELIEVAQCYSQCAAAASPDSNLSQQYIEKALRAIDQAIGKGYKDVVVLETEPDLGALRGRTEFQALLARLKDR